MASVQTGSYDGRYLKLSVWEESTNIANNTSTVRWKLESIGGNVNYYTIYNWGVWVYGQEKYGTQTTNWNSYNFPAATGSREGTVTVTHNNDGTASDVGFTLKGSVYYNRNNTYNGSCPLSTIPRQANVTSATDFNDEQNPTIKYNNPGGFRLNARLEFGGVNIQRDNIGNSGSYTFNLTEAERTLLREKCTGTSMTVREVIATCISGTTEQFWSWQDKTMTIVNGNPTFASSNISYEDTNSSIVAITGNNQHIVQNRSNLVVTFTDATPKKSASIVRYEVTFNGATQNKTSPTSIDYGTVNSSQNLSVSIKAVDSRGNSTTASKTITILGWVLPTASILAKRVNNYEDDTKLKVAVTISSVNSKNAIQSIKYRYRKSGTSSYNAYTSLSDNVETTVVIDKLFAWDFQVVIQDKFGTTTYNLVVPKGMPILFIDILLQSIGINCFPSVANSLFVNGINFFDLFPIGSCKMTTTNVNPQTVLTGTTWELTASGNLISGVSRTFYLWTRTS